MRAGCLEIGHVRFGRRAGETHQRQRRQGAPVRPHQLAEHAGDVGPWNPQHLLGRAVWEEGTLRDFTRRYVVAGLADSGAAAGPGGAGVLAVDETGFAKRGTASAGVARQYSGALVGVFACQIGVMMSWATGAGRALIDRELYLPSNWT